MYIGIDIIELRKDIDEIEDKKNELNRLIDSAKKKTDFAVNNNEEKHEQVRKYVGKAEELYISLDRLVKQLKLIYRQCKRDDISVKNIIERL